MDRSNGPSKDVREDQMAKVLLIGSASLDWPPLPEVQDVADSWIDCDVSSVASSSWLDVTCLDHDTDDDSEGDTILVTASTLQAHAHAPKQVAPPLWSAIVGRTAALAEAPIHGVAVPPPLYR